MLHGFEPRAGFVLDLDDGSLPATRFVPMSAKEHLYFTNVSAWLEADRRFPLA
jgi:hypothetical protein